MNKVTQNNPVWKNEVPAHPQIKLHSCNDDEYNIYNTNTLIIVVHLDILMNMNMNTNCI